LYFKYISYTGDPLFYSNFKFVSFYVIVPQYKNGIGIYSTFNFLRCLLVVLFIGLPNGFESAKSF